MDVASLEEDAAGRRFLLDRCCMKNGDDYDEDDGEETLVFPRLRGA